MPEAGTTNRTAKRHGPSESAVAGVLLSVPAAALVLVFILVPVGYGLWLSLHQWSGFNEPSWVGMDNYVRLFTRDAQFTNALENNIIFAAASVIGRNVLGLLIALVLVNLSRGRTFARTSVFLPATMSLVAVAAMWAWIFNPSIGLLNRALTAVGLQDWAQVWLGNESTALTAIIAVDIWRWVGFHAVLYYVGIQAIPRELYDAATVDGAGATRRLFSITLPLLVPVIVVNLVLSMAGAFVRNFDLIYVMTGGGPNRATEVVPTLMVKEAFTNGNLGYATAMGFVLFALIGIAVTLVLLAARRFDDGLD